MEQNLGTPDFEAIVNLYYEDLYRFAWSLARNPDDASDLTQQTFAIYAEKGHQIREVERVKSWLFTSLYREYLRFSERRKRTVSTEEVDAEIPEPVMDSQVERQDDRSNLLQALTMLEDEPRVILGLFYLEQVSYKEIAEILNIPIGTVMSRLSRAKESLRKKIESLNGSVGIKVVPIDSYQQKKDSNG